MMNAQARTDRSNGAGEIVRLGTVAEVDLAGGRITVDMGEVRTGPIRWSTGRSGGTRIWSPPSIGEQVILLCPEGDIAAAVAIGSIPQNAFPPAGNNLRELIEYSDGAVIAYDPEAHRLEVILPDNATAAIVAGGGFTLDARQGGVTILGDIALDGKLTASGDVLAEGNVSLAHHKHIAVQSGSGISGEPA